MKSSSKLKATIVVTTLNEKKGVEVLAQHIKEFENWAEEVFAIDGGSKDGTVEVLREHKIRVVGQRRPGRGAAIREAVSIASQNHIVIFRVPDRGSVNPPPLGGGYQP